jgi:hypothetical protein
MLSLGLGRVKNWMGRTGGAGGAAHEFGRSAARHERISRLFAGQAFDRMADDRRASCHLHAARVTL